jgi:hypothetical protein
VTVTGVTVTDTAGGSWTPLVHLTAGGQFADASVWVKDAGASPVAQKVTVTMAPSGVLDVGLAVRQFTGAAVAASQTGRTAKVAGSATVAVTPLVTGSQVVGAAGWGGGGGALTPTSATSQYGQTDDTTFGAAEAAFEAAALSVAGTPVTVGYTAAKGGIGLAAAEILPA